MTADGPKRAGGALIDGQKKCRKVVSGNYVHLSCTKTIKSRVFLSAVASSTKRRFFPSVQVMASRVLFKKRTSPQLIKKFLLFYGTRRFITAFTRVRHLSLSWARSVQSTPLHTTAWRSILKLSFHLLLGLRSGFVPSGFHTKTQHAHL
jgi:hypothetical protein